MDPATLLRILIQRTFAAVPELMATWGLHPETAVRYSLIREYMIMANMKAPGIVSGYRSREQQRCLLENFQAGQVINSNCSMPVSKPACSSRHTTTVAGVPAATAIDVYSRAPDLPVFSQLWSRMPYGVSGSSFNDPNHFHIDLPFPRPTSICN